MMKMEVALVVGFFAFLGASLGSFLNVVALRSISGKSWSGGERSVCAACGTVLEWMDLVPIASWCLLRGRCRHCGEKISVRYFAVEIISGFLTLLAGPRILLFFGSALGWPW